MAVKLSAFYPRVTTGTHFHYRLSKLLRHTAAEGINQLKNAMTSSGIEHTTFWLVA
jgi:hypothetical protein